jgi:type IV secretory pathway VirB2 component (pilin)
MPKTKTKKLIFASVMFFLFFNMFLPVSFANWCTDLGGSLNPMNLCYCPDGTVAVSSPCGGSNPTPTPTPDPTPDDPTPTPDNPTPTPDNPTPTPDNPTPTPTPNGTGLVKCGNEGGQPCTFNDFIAMINDVVNFVMFSIVPPIAVVTIVIAAINLMTSSGDPGKLEQAKKTLIWIIFGLVVVYGAWAIVKGFITALGGGGETLKFFK